MDTWVQGRAFVYAGFDEAEYSYRFEKSVTYPWKDAVRSFSGRLRALDKCRQLDYVRGPEALKMTF